MKMSGPSKVDEEHWQAEADLRHLVEAQKIAKDRPRHRRALKLAREQMKSLGKIAE